MKISINILLKVITLSLFSFTALSSPYIEKKATLLGVYNDAVLYNSDIAAALADYKAKQEATPQAVAGLLPQINSGGSLETGRTNIRRPNITHNYGGTVFQANISQPVFRLDRWYQLGAAKSTVMQAQYEYAAKQQQLILQSAEYYFNVLRTNDLLAVAKAEEEAYQIQLTQTKGRLKGGVSTITDVLDAQSAYDMAQANTELAKRKQQESFEQLTRLTKRQYDDIDGISHDIPVLAPQPNISKDWVETAMKQNLTLMSAEYNVKAAQETYKQRQAGHAPTVDLNASYRNGNNDPMGYTNTTSAGYRGTVSQSSISLQLNVPVFTGGMTSSQAREANQRVFQSEELQTTQQREVLMQTRNFFRALNSDVYQIKARKKTMVSSYKAVVANQIGYRVGNRSMTDVLTAQRQLYSAVRDYNNVRYDYILDSLRLKQMAGTLKVEDLKDLSQFLLKDYDPDKDFLPREIVKSTTINNKSARPY